MSRGGSVNTLVIRPSNLRKDWEPFAPIRSSTAVLITVLVLHTLPPGFTQSKASDDRILDIASGSIDIVESPRSTLRGQDLDLSI
ncbi:unnamed protein product [Zymoseptoria tritici ST99CH_1E4]|uniref:Uncharacterized protein n=1 Tax=Zymoseptoria tritici ST99CH_1E4 TaxID=1276532 RepID=A0A2H1GHC5_ZYMTR|nr:unnamed protein product [Zymoseptoria tritici ST99CH_1E4]